MSHREKQNKKKKKQIVVWEALKIFSTELLIFIAPFGWDENLPIE